MTNVEPDTTVFDLNRHQPEFDEQLWQYLNRRVSDYRITDGVLLPYRIDRYLKGGKIETIEVAKYEFDIPAAPSLFAPGRRAQ